MVNNCNQLPMAATMTMKVTLYRYSVIAILLLSSIFSLAAIANQKLDDLELALSIWKVDSNIEFAGEYHFGSSENEFSLYLHTHSGEVGRPISIRSMK